MIIYKAFIFIFIFTYILSFVSCFLKDSNQRLTDIIRIEVEYEHKHEMNGFSYKSISPEEHLVYLDVFPSQIEPNSKFNWTVAWKTSPTTLASNSWIGTYPYAQKTASSNEISFFNLNKKFSGHEHIQVPKNAGIYEIRYIRDNNLQTMAFYGPLVVNPFDSKLIIVKTNYNVGENILIRWDIQESLFKENDEVILCLNVIGSYDECIWANKIDSRNGIINLDLPNFAGYFVFRVIKYIHSFKILPEEQILVVSQILKISNPNYSLKTNKTSVVSSTVDTEWMAEDAEYLDWIGLYSLDTTDVFTQSYKPVQSIKVKSKSSGRFEAFLPPNTQAGPYIFIYFSNHIPVAVSDIVNLHQPKVSCPINNSTMSNIKHLVIICTENHSFDSYFGKYCNSATNSNPTCNYGRNCCEKAPDMVEGHHPFKLNDTQNMAYDPDHSQDCEKCQINGGRMDGYITGCFCSNNKNFAIAEFNETLAILHDYARQYSLADHYFQPSAGASSQNDMYLARASYVFKDNTKIPVGGVGTGCQYLKGGIPDRFSAYYDPTITNLLAKCGFVLKSFAEGYKNASLNFEKTECYPDGYDAGDIPYNYYGGITDNPKYMGDYEDFKIQIKNGTLPDVSFIKPLGINTAHPANGNITNENKFIKDAVDAILNSKYAEDTLILWVPDESGGFYDHIAPPPTNDVDKIPYGPRIPFLVIGKFAKKNYVSHVVMEHSSIVKFIEWNWLNGKTGQLNTRDRNVNSIGDLIDAEKAGLNIPN